MGSNVSMGLALGCSIATGAGEAGERVYICRGCFPQYLQYIRIIRIRIIFIDSADYILNHKRP